MLVSLRTLYTPLMVLTSLASICGNLLLLLVLLLNKELRSDTLGLTLSFSLSDLALGLCITSVGAHNSLSWSEGYTSESAFCQGSGFIFLLLQTSSIQSLTWATVDRFTEICFALSYSSIWTASRCRALLILIWVFCLFNATLPLLGFGSYVYSKSRFLCCLGFTLENRYFVMQWTLLGIIVPVLTMCSLNGYIVYVARKQTLRGTFMCNDLHCYYVPANIYLRSSIVMVSTSVCLLVCWLPYISVCLYETFIVEQSPAVSSALSTWLALTSAALNPWITCLTQTRYRVAARHSVCRFVQRWSGTPQEPHPQSSTLCLESTNRVSTMSGNSLDTSTPL
ncbi:adenosine receptor A3 [Channa argus]|uniref:adenosine receptor A3 n=1 Tax=Channa argus TaxID=215402 RepID=UPI003520D506